MGDEFRSLAYLKVVRSINKFEKKITIENIDEIKGVGKSIREKIIEILKTNKLKLLDDLKKNPYLKKIEKLSKIKGFSQEKIIELIKKYNIKSVKDIRNLYKEEKINLNKNQLMGLKYANDLIKQIPRDEVKLFGKELRKIVKSLNSEMLIVGSYRRKKDYSGDIDILVYKKSKKKVVDKKLLKNIVEKLKNNLVGVFSMGTTKFSGLVKTEYSPNVRQVDILNVPYDNLPAALMYFTGSGTFNRRIRLIAKEKGCKLSEKGLECHGKKIKLNNERDIFKVLNIPFIKPENRLI